jgi:hypothetical protein
MDDPEILVPQERVEVDSRERHLCHWGPTVLGYPVPRDKTETRPSARILRK